MDEAVVGLDALPRRLPGVVGEHDTRRAVDDRVEQPVAGIGARAEPGAVDAVGVDLCATDHHRPQRRGSRRAVRQRRPERAVQHDRRDGGRASGRWSVASANAAANSSRPRSAAARSGSITSGSRRPAASTMRAWISGSGSGPSGGSSTGRRRWNTFLRELEVEERRLELLELGGGRQHVVRLPRRLGHEHVDADAHVERPHRLAHPLAVGDRVHRVAGLDDQAR